MGECIFCKIIDGEIPSKKVYEDERVFAFEDINPEAPIHVLIVPKKHISNINELTEEEEKLIGHIFFVSKKIADEYNIKDTGYRVVSNCGKDGGQTVDHLHFHLLGGRNLNWPPG
ncbi:histidine triad nucleotide-binding protein [Clostridium sediminicola]|uniref:histidine triad nucleotide-binding protein n=1 Tax=Clostridium sediminicola TaxID=3114879 RepID=UPI0031F272B1